MTGQECVAGGVCQHESCSLDGACCFLLDRCSHGFTASEFCEDCDEADVIEAEIEAAERGFERGSRDWEAWLDKRLGR